MISDRTLNARNQGLKAKQKENEDLVYIVNYSAELGADTISASAWSSEDSGIAITNDSEANNQAQAQISGDIGSYRLINKITTATGEVLERCFEITITDNNKFVRDYE